MKIASRVGKTLLILWAGLLIAAAILQVDHSIHRNLFDSGLLGFIFGKGEQTPVISPSASVCFVTGFALWLVGVLVLVIDRRRAPRTRGPHPVAPQKP